MFPVNGVAGRLAVVAVAIVALVAFLLWSKRTASPSFFWGVLAGTGVVLSFDIVWVHWLFGLHHVTMAREDVVLEPVLVVTGLAFVWFGVTRERQRAGPR